MSQAVRLSSIRHGADFEVDLSAFPEAEPVFAYVDDVRAGVSVLHGLVIAGKRMIADQASFMWLDGPRDCVLLKTSTEGQRHGRAAFRSLAVGEFCLEIYHLRPDGSAEVLHQDNFCFK